VKYLIFFVLMGVGAAALLASDWDTDNTRLIEWVIVRMVEPDAPDEPDVEPEPEPEPDPQPEPVAAPVADPAPESPPEPEPLGARASTATLRTAVLPAGGSPHIARSERAASWIVYRSLDGGDAVRTNSVVGKSAVVVSGGHTYVAGRLTARRKALLVVVLAKRRVPPDLAGLVAVGEDADSCVALLSDREREAVRDRLVGCAIYVTDEAPRGTGVTAPVASAVVEVAPPPAVSLATTLVKFEPRWPAGVPTRVAALRAGDLVQSLASVTVSGTEVPLFIADQVCGELIVQQDILRVRVETDDVLFESLFTAKAGDTLPALGSATLACSVPGVGR